MKHTKTNDLKNVFKAMKVHEPLKLSKPSSNAQAPQPQQIVAPPLGVPFSAESQKENHQTLQAVNEESRSKLSQNVITESVPSESEPHIQMMSSQKKKPASVNGDFMQSQREKAQKLQPQKMIPASVDDFSVQSQQEESHLEQAAEEEAQNVASSFQPAEEINGQPQGFFKLAHAVFWDAKLREMPGDCFRLFLWLSSRAWQYRESQGVIRASVRWMEEQTGMSHTTVSRSLNLLKDLNLIEVLEQDYRDGNLWKISRNACSSEENKKSKEKLKIKNELPANVGAGSPKDESCSHNLGTQLPQKVGKYKKESRTFKKTTLSPALPENIRRYFETLKPYRKREGELQAFRELLLDYSAEEISQCLDHLQKHGLPKTRETCHSPMGFLATMISAVINEIEEIKRRTEAKRRQEEKLQQEQEERRREEETSRLAEKSFMQTFSSPKAQDDFIENFVQERFSSFPPPQSVARSMAIRDWYDRQLNN